MVVVCSLGRWSIDLAKSRKNMFGVVISPVHFFRGLFCYSNFNFFYIDDKKEFKYYKQNKTNREPTATSSNICFIYKNLLLTSLKSICLAKELFLVNFVIGVFRGILWQVSQQVPRKIPLIFGIFSIILTICCCHLVVYYLTKPIWIWVSAS